jgi:Histone methylation protein DOT1
MRRFLPRQHSCLENERQHYHNISVTLICWSRPSQAHWNSFLFINTLLVASMTAKARSHAEVELRRTVDSLMDDEVEPWVSKPGYDVFDVSETLFVNDQVKLLTPDPIMAAASEAEMIQNGIHEQNHEPATYGEVTSAGARQLFNHMGMATTNAPPTNNNGSTCTNHDSIVFVDLGSGRGKLVIQAYMELSRITKATGIELAPSRHQAAVEAWEELQSTARKLRASQNEGHSLVPEAEIEFLLEDLLESDLSQVTHIYLSSLCFPDKLMYHVAKKLEKDAPKLQCVATLREFPMEFENRGIPNQAGNELFDGASGMKRRSEFVEMSWTKRRGGGCEVHVYTKGEPSG